MGLDALGELQMWSRGANGRSHTIVAFCPLYHPPKRTLDLESLDDDTADWLQTTALSIEWHKIGPYEKEAVKIVIALKAFPQTPVVSDGIWTLTRKMTSFRFPENIFVFTVRAGLEQSISNRWCYFLHFFSFLLSNIDLSLLFHYLLYF